MKILFFLFIIGLFFIAFTLLFGFTFLRMVFRAIFGTQPNSRNVSSNKQKAKQPSSQTKTPPSKKIIAREEGEYVDFVEIKDS
jgi:hypothetical protein